MTNEPPGPALPTVTGRPPGRTTLALPPAQCHVSGREDLVREAVDLLRPAGGGDGAPRVVLLTSRGRVGLGTSTVAVAVARRLRPSYPDGVLYVDLRSDLGGTDVDLHRILGDLLLSFGITRTAVPDDVDERAALHRATLAGRRSLLVVDNAPSDARVTALLPGPGTGAAIVAGRDPLPGLAGRRLTVGPLSRDAASELVGRLTGSTAAVPAVVAVAQGVPLTLRFAAGGLRTAAPAQAAAAAHHFAAAAGAAEGDHRVLAAARFVLAALRPDQVDALCAIASVRLPALPLWGSAAAVGGDPAAAEELVRDLTRMGLLDVVGQDLDGQPRHRVQRLVEGLLPPATEEARHMALTRVGHGYVRAVEHAAGALVPGLRPILGQRPPAPTPLPQVERVAALAQTPSRWFGLEHRNVMLLIDRLDESGLDELTVLLASASVEFFELGSHWTDWEECTRAALSAARRCGWALGEANAMRNLGRLEYYRDGPLDGPWDLLTGAREIFRAEHCGPGVACCTRHLGVVAAIRGETDAALALLTESLQLFEDAGARNAGARTRVRLGDVLRAAGRLAESCAVLSEAITTFDELGNEVRRARAQVGLALTCQALGRDGDAVDLLRRAARIFRRHGDVTYEADALLGLARIYQNTGALDAAETARSTAAQLLAREPGHLGDGYIATGGPTPRVSERYPAAMRVGTEAATPPAGQVSVPG